MCLKLHNSTTVLLLDIPDGGGFYKLEGELTILLAKPYRGNNWPDSVYMIIV
eukprot:Pgem_evm1s3626